LRKRALPLAEERERRNTKKISKDTHTHTHIYVCEREREREKEKEKEKERESGFRRERERGCRLFLQCVMLRKPRLTHQRHEFAVA
jgi:hypothetical protein